MAGIYSSVRSAVRRGVWKALEEYFPDESLAPIIYSHMNGTEPSESYVVINLLGVYPQGRAQISTLTTTDFKYTYSSNYEVEYRLVFVGSDGGDLAHTFANKVAGSPSVKDAFRANKLGYMRKGAIARSPVKRETQWVDYHSLDITLSYQVMSQEEIDYFDSVIINGIVVNGGDVEVYNETFAIPEDTPIP